MEKHLIKGKTFKNSKYIVLSALVLLCSKDLVKSLSVINFGETFSDDFFDDTWENGLHLYNSLSEYS